MTPISPTIHLPSPGAQRRRHLSSARAGWDTAKVLIPAPSAARAATGSSADRGLLILIGFHDARSACAAAVSSANSHNVNLWNIFVAGVSPLGLTAGPGGGIFPASYGEGLQPHPH